MLSIGVLLSSPPRRRWSFVTSVGRRQRTFVFGVIHVRPGVCIVQFKWCLASVDTLLLTCACLVAVVGSPGCLVTF